mgnify:CR=1 FL=1
MICMQYIRFQISEIPISTYLRLLIDEVRSIGLIISSVIIIIKYCYIIIFIINYLILFINS